jgi:parallel beta-helix repeat protein
VSGLMRVVGGVVLCTLLVAGGAVLRDRPIDPANRLPASLFGPPSAPPEWVAALSSSSTTGTSVVSSTTSTLAGVTTTTAVSSTSTSTTVSSSTTVVSSVSGGVRVGVGESIQGAVDAYPAGTTFVIGAGVHRGQSVVPKDGDVFVGESGAVLSGEGVTEFAFGAGGKGVTVRGLVIEKYATPTQAGVIRAGGGATGWVVEDCEVRYNGGTGIRAGAGWRVSGNFVHHNGQLGVFGAGGGIVVEDNEIAFNNTENVDSHWEAGGTKFVHTKNLVVRGNYVHDNKGPGLWTDGHNIYTLYENNRVMDNFGPGIDHEISHDAVIRNNVVEGNGFGWTGWVDGAGILVNTSSNVEVYGNTVRFNNDGIAGIHTSRGSDELGARELKNLWVHDNVIVMNVGQSGVVTNTSDPVFSAGWNNRFDYNTYTLGSAAKYYRWAGATITTDQWKAYGQDPHSTWK